MIVLALDTSGVDCSAAVYDGDAGVVLAEISETIGKGHAEKLMSVIDGALEIVDLPLQAVERIAVTVGPGSFTGIRVGVAAARGLALSLGVEAVGVTTLEVLAASGGAQYPGKAVVAAIDAKRGEVYAQAFAVDGTPLTQASAMSPAEAAGLAGDHDAAMIGSAAPLLAGETTGAEPDKFPIAIVARIGAAAIASAEKPKPLYLRAPDAKPQAGFAISRM